MSSITVLVVDDEKPLQDFIRRNLEVRGYKVLTASNGLEALALLEAGNVDLIIMDLMMPHMDGLETTRRIRATSVIPIIILTALDEESDKVRAFDLGADDYLTKPFGVGELLGRTKAVLRRSQWSSGSTSTQPRLVRGDVSVDIENHHVAVRNQPIELTPIEFELLAYLMHNAGKVLSHRVILQHVWGPEYGSESEYLRVYMGRLRQKIEADPLNPQLLFTERGIGYRFEP